MTVKEFIPGKKVEPYKVNRADPEISMMILKLYFRFNVPIKDISIISGRKMEAVQSLIFSEKDAHYTAEKADFPEKPKIGRPKKETAPEVVAKKPSKITPSVKPSGIAFGYGHKLRF